MRPYRYLITCPAGLEVLAERELSGADPAASVDTRLSGLLSFKSALSGDALLDQRCASNLFRVLGEQGFPSGGKGGRLPDPSAALLKFLSSEKTFRDFDPRPGATFRVMLSSENSLVAPDRAALSRAEEAISAETGMRPSRAGADTEFWLLLRNEGRIYFGQRLSKRRATERDLEKGELKPEIAHAVCAAAALRPGERVLDPFCGSGSIPLECLESRPGIVATAGDSDGAKTARLAARIRRADALAIKTADFLDPASYPEESFDAVLTDPPWGSFAALEDSFGFYAAFVAACARVLKPGGRLVFLSGAKPECEAAFKGVSAKGLELKERLDILVSGHKAAIWICAKG
jgi:23S rRNA G2445 N2-methylase RlmL